jgi:hypothetical protein
MSEQLFNPFDLREGDVIYRTHFLSAVKPQHNESMQTETIFDGSKDLGYITFFPVQENPK